MRPNSPAKSDFRITYTITSRTVLNMKTVSSVLVLLFVSVTALDGTLRSNDDRTFVAISIPNLVSTASYALVNNEDVSIAAYNLVYTARGTLNPIRFLDFNGSVEGLYDLTEKIGANQISPQCLIDLATWYQTLRQNSSFALSCKSPKIKILDGHPNLIV